MPLFLKKNAIRHMGSASVAPCIIHYIPREISLPVDTFTINQQNVHVKKKVALD
jgi:hypothetical protein